MDQAHRGGFLSGVKVGRKRKCRQGKSLLNFRCIRMQVVSFPINYFNLLTRSSKYNSTPIM